MAIRIIDTTLRDGMHAVSHGFSPDNVKEIVSGLDKAGANTIEISHGDGLGGSSFQYGRSAFEEEKLFAAASKVRKKAKLAALLLPGIGTIEDLKRVRSYGFDSVRVATHVTEADVGEQHIGYAKKSGMEAIGFLMMTHMVSPEKVLEQAKLFQSYGADMVYCADSAGTMIPQNVTDMIGLLASELNIPVGFHAHNNLGLAIGNTMAGIEAGATSVDTTLRGLGAGAGNAPHEVMLAVLEKMNYETSEDLYLISDIAEEIVKPLMRQPLEIDKIALTIGYAGVYGSFYLHAMRAAEKFGLDARDILVELGRLKTVGGQEDMIVDVAYKLSKNK